LWKGAWSCAESCSAERLETPDLGEQQTSAVAPNVLDRSFETSAPNRKWIADFTYVWTAEEWLYLAAVIDLLSRRDHDM
jgi:putative transposase